MKLVIDVEGMSCGSCEKRIENTLSNTPGIKKIEANFTEGTVTIDLEHKDDKIISKIEKEIEDLGFKVKEKHF